MQANDLYRLPSDVAKGRHFCIVTETYLPEINGVAQTLARLTEGLRWEGHNVSLVRPRQRGSDNARGHYDPNLTLVSSIPLPGYRGLHIGLPAGAVLRRCWNRQRPDVVYIATQGPLGWSAVAVARRLGIPVFGGFHTNFDSYCKYYHAGWLRFFILRYLRNFHRRTTGTLVPSAELRRRLRALGLRNVAVLGRGVDCRLFTPQRRNTELRRMWRAAKDDLVILYVGRLAAEKNLALAIESYRAMQRVNNAVKFVLVGDGPLRAGLQKKHPDLIFSGVHTGEQLARHYASADIFLFPSETETFGNVTLEAMASGLVVVAYDYAAAHLHIHDGETGVLSRYGDAEGFVAAAAALARKPEKIVAIRQHARRHTAAIDWQLVVRRFAALLTEAIKPNYEAVLQNSSPSLSTASPMLPRELIYRN